MTTRGFILGSAFRGIAYLAVCLLWISTAEGQTPVPGNNAVYNSNGNCSAGSPCAPSSAFIDTTVLPGADICDTIYQVLHSASYTAAVFDARGISTHMTCNLGSPWFENGTGYVNKPSTILLPAGTITASIPWVLPTNTKLIGVAKGNVQGNGDNYILETTIVAGFSSGAVVQFGDSNCPSSGCQGISVEHLTINGNSQTVNGIENDNCGLLCYVDHVTMYQVLGTGLMVSGTNATDSGPYSNITFDVGSSMDTMTQCAQIKGTNGTRGIHGITCIASPAATNGILLDASNNSIEDVRIIGFYNGIVVGSHAAAKSNVLLNIYGDTNTSIQQPINLIQIYSGTVSDLAIIAVANPATGTTTIQDLQGLTTLSDPYVGMYVLGDPGSGGNSRFTTSTTMSANAATWMFGSGAPHPLTPCAMGSLYSDASGTATSGLYVCTPSGWQGVPTQ